VIWIPPLVSPFLVVASCWRMCTCWGGVFIEVHDLCAQCNSVCVHGKHSTQCNRSQPNKTIFPWVFSLFSYPYVLCEHDRYKYIACSPPPKWKAAAMKAIPPPCRPICNNLIFSLLDPFRFMSPLISHAKFFVLFIYYLAWSQPMAMAV
jgi:hypothetical protein